jgi:diguanylate cyclase (GGDEF)-like protein/PAS domain S-box-containing protein
MDTKELRRPRLYTVQISILVSLIFVLAMIFIDAPHHAVRGAAITVVFAATVYLLFRFSRHLRKHYLHYLETKAQLERERLLVKRKSRLAAYFDRVLKDAADMIFTLDIDGYILKFNSGAEHILGFHQHEIVGRPFAELLLDPAEAAVIFDIVLKNDRVQNQELRMKAGDGRIIEVSMSISEMRDEKNQILGMVATCKDITENKRLEQELILKNQQLEELATTDNLSGLFNVRHFHNEMSKAFTRLKRRFYTTLTLLLIDIDHFKELNDSEGHQAGDAVIERLGEIIRGAIRKDLDSGYRYGGDEFVVLLLETDAKNSTVVAERILNRFNEKKSGKTSLSVGIAMVLREDNEESLIRRADEAMYEAKRSGGNRYLIFQNKG